MNTVPMMQPVHQTTVSDYMEMEWNEAEQRYMTTKIERVPYVGEMTECKSGFLKVALAIGAAIAAPYAVPALAGALGGSTVLAGALYGAAAGALTTGSLKGALMGGIGGGIGGAFMSSGAGGFAGGASGGGVGAVGGGSFAGNIASGAAGGLAGVASSSLASGLDFTGGATGGGASAGGGGGPLLDVNGTGGAPALSNIGGGTPSLTPSGGGVFSNGAAPTLTPAGGAAPSLTPSGGGEFSNGTQPGAQPGWWEGIKKDIVGKVTDPKQFGEMALKMGGRYLAGNMAEEPNFGYDAYGAKASAMLDKQSSLMDLQDAQYRKNVPGLQDNATGLAALASNPYATARQSVDDFKLTAANQEQQMHDQLVRAGYAPGSPQYTQAMSRVQYGAGLGRVQAYNSGFDTGVKGGMTALASAKGMHDVPNYGAGASNYVAAGGYGVGVKERQMNAQNQEAGAISDLFFPPDPYKDVRTPGMAT